ncbi:hypothetical protein VUR80DRAFT_8443 [Thermomyces stellatus]
MCSPYLTHRFWDVTLEVVCAWEPTNHKKLSVEGPAAQDSRVVLRSKRTRQKLTRTLPRRGYQNWVQTPAEQATTRRFGPQLMPVNPSNLGPTPLQPPSTPSWARLSAGSSRPDHTGKLLRIEARKPAKEYST